MAHGVPEVLSDRLDGPKSPLVAVRLRRAIDTAEGAPGCQPSLGGRQAFGLEFLCQQIEVGLPAAVML